MAKEATHAGQQPQKAAETAQPAPFQEVAGEAEAERASASFLTSGAAEDAAAPAFLLRADAAMRQRLIQQMQRERGNEYVQRVVVRLAPARRAGGQPLVVQRVEGGQWRQEHEAAAREAAVSAARGRMMVQGETELFQGYVLSPEPAALEKVLKAIIAESGFKGATKFYMDYSFHWGLSREQSDLRAKILPVMQSKLNELEAKGKTFAEQQFGPAAVAYLLQVLQDSEKVVNKEAERYGLTEKTTRQSLPVYGGGMTVSSKEYGLADNESTKGMVTAAKSILDRYNRLSELNKKREGLEEKTEIMESVESGTQLRLRGTGQYSTRITDPAAHKQVCEDIAKAQEEYIQARAGAEATYPILASFRPPEGIDRLRSVAEGPRGGVAMTVGMDIAAKRENIKKLRDVAYDGKFIWKQESIIAGAKKAMGVQPRSVEDRAIEAKIAAVEHSELMRNLGLGLLSLIGAALAAIPTGGGSLVAWGAAGAGTGLLLGTAGVSIYEGIREYQIQKAATGTAFDRAQAISQQDPSLFWLAVAIVGAVADIGMAAATFAKAARAIRSLEKAAQTEEMARAAYRNAGLGGIMSEEEFVQHFMRSMKADVIGATTKARSALIDQLAKGQYPGMAALVAGDEGAMLNLLKSHGKWEVLIADLQAGSEEMKQVAGKLVAYRQREVIDKINEIFGGKLIPGSGKTPVSDLDFSLVSEANVGAGERLMKAETYMVNKFGPGWEEMWRVNFYTDLKSRLLVTEEIMPMLGEADKAKLLLKQHELSNKFNLARRLQYAQSDPTAIARIEQEAQSLGVSLDEIRKLASMGEEAGRLQRNTLLLKADALEAQYRTATGTRKVELAKQIQELQMEANFYTTEAVIAPGAALELTGSQAQGLQVADAIMEWTTMLEHKVHEYGNAAKAMWEYEPWKYMDRQINFALRAKLDPDLVTKLQTLKNRANYIYTETERTWAKETKHIGGPAHVEKVNVEIYNSFLADMRSVAGSIRDSEMGKLKAAAGTAP